MATSSHRSADDTRTVPLTRFPTDINVGDISIYTRSVKGRFRARRMASLGAIYGLFFVLPYLDWNGRQAVLFDIPARKFYFFGAVIWPQDFWLLAMFLLFCFLFLFALTSVRGRVFCGFMCPQTAWSAALAAIERFIEGGPQQRMRLDALPWWNVRKLRIKSAKHVLWLTVCSVTAVTFIGYFAGIGDAWRAFVMLDFNVYEGIAFTFVVVLFYVNSGFMREQVCMWICPYARIQGVFTDLFTRMTSYDAARGEPRGKLKRAESELGDCVDCKMCVAVCPTGVDIREGQQLGCINCGVCIDACDSVMERIGKSRGLIRFASKFELERHASDRGRLLRAGPSIYAAVASIAFTVIIVGVIAKSDVGINVRHERDPLFTVMSDGTIQNSYEVSLLNKTEVGDTFEFRVEGLDGVRSNLDDGGAIALASGQIRHMAVRLRAPRAQLPGERQGVRFVLRSRTRPAAVAHYDTVFMAPPP
jgi:cytochrome c oxidase accessory protein FixG